MGGAGGWQGQVAWWGNRKREGGIREGTEDRWGGENEGGGGSLQGLGGRGAGSSNGE